MEYNLAILTP